MKTIKVMALAILFSLTSCSTDDSISSNPNGLPFTSHICKVVFENPWGNFFMNVRVNDQPVTTNRATSYEITLNTGQKIAGQVFDDVETYHPMISIYVDGVLVAREESVVSHIVQ